MRHIHYLVFLLCCLCVVVMPAQAATAGIDDNAAFLQPKLVPPVWGMDPLRVALERDEAKCRKAYGEEWWLNCFVRLGATDAEAAGVTLRGENLPEGVWRWDIYEGLVFTPKTPWKENTNFSVDISELALPARVRFSTRVLTGSTLPLAGQSAKGEVWIDPSASGERAVSFALRFTAPVGTDEDRALEKHMSIEVPKNFTGLGKMQVVWGQEGTSCLVKVPLKALPDTDTPLTLQVRGVRPLDTTHTKVQLLAGDLKASVTIPGKKQLFTVREAELTLENTKTLQQEYQLHIKTSLRVPAAELLKALKVVELPRVQNPEATIPYKWDAAPTVTPEDLAKARPLRVEMVKDPGESGEALVLRVPATPGSYVYCTLPAGFGPKGYTLAAPWNATYAAGSPKGSVSFLQPGNVLTLSPGGDNRLDIVSSGVDTLRWRAVRVKSDALNLMHILTSDYDRFAAYGNLDASGSAVEGSISLPGVQQDDLSPRFSTLALSDLMRGGTGFMRVELAGLREDKVVSEVVRLVLATDLGMVSKLLPGGGREVFVCSLSSGRPLENVHVRILGLNGVSVAAARTDAAGHAVLPAVRGLKREKTPVALIASRTVEGEDAREDLAWISLDDSKRRVDYSRFPIQGQVSSPDNINVYVFGQRGIFRPGENVFFGFVIRRGDWAELPADMPLVATLRDPAGRVAMQRTFSVGQGLAELAWQSSEFSPTGRYRLDVTTPGANDILGSGAVRIEEFQPDTLAIRADLLKPVPQGGKDEIFDADTRAGWLVTPALAGAPPAEAALAVHLRNFYGMPAAGRKVRAELSVRPASLLFTGFEDYTFPDIVPLGKEAEAAAPVVLPETLSSADGQARIALPLTSYQNRTLLCRVLVEGFEADGGRAVTTEKSFLVSPLPVMLGYRLAGAVSVMNYVPQGTKGGLEFVALGPDLRPAGAGTIGNGGSLRLSVAERRYVTVLTTDAQGKYVYEESPVDKEISGTTVKVDASTGRFAWDMPTMKAGEFLLTVRDGERIMARIPYTVAGNDDVRLALHTKNDQLQSTQLRLRLDKTDYAPGDTVNIFMAAPYAGVGLITLERDGVAAHEWFKAEPGHSVHRLTIPKDFEGRGYINVTMGRAISSPEIFMQPHSYAVAPLTVNVAARDMGLKLSAPQQVLPGGVIKARLTARHTGKAVVFAVDEGVLQLTRFACPEPLRYLLVDRALEVQTDQLFDLLMPVHSQLAKRLPAFGGDMHMGGGRFDNPFKRRNEPPLAWWSGMVDVGTQEGVDVSIPVPAYTNGQVRIMAVAVSDQSTGSTQASTISRAPLVLTPQLPLMVAPGDVFEGGVSLHNTTQKPFTVNLKTESTLLHLEQPLPDKLAIPAGKEVFVPLRVVAPTEPGEAVFTVLARVSAEGHEGAGSVEDTGAGKGVQQEFRRSATLSVRPATLPRQEQQTGLIAVSPQAGERTLPTAALSRERYVFKADASAAVSAGPLAPLRVLLRNLAAYPYTCVEQTISRAFPLVLLHRRAGLVAALTPPEINGKPRAEAHTLMLEQALSAIRAAYRPGEEYGTTGGMAPWSDMQYVSSLLTAYAGDYLLSLREAGLNLPGDLSSSYFTTLQKSVVLRPESLPQCRVEAYKLWVLTRQGVVTTSWLETLHEHIRQNWKGWENDVTGTLLAGSYALMNMHGPAQEIMNAGGAGILLEVGNSVEAISHTAAYALHVAVLARNFPERLHSSAAVLAERLMEGTNVLYVSTLDAALGARALLELAAPLQNKQGPQKKGSDAKDAVNAALAGLELRCTAYQQGFEPAAPSIAAPADTSLPLLSLSAPGCTQFSLNKAVQTPLYFEVSADGYDRIPPKEAVHAGMEVTRRITQPDGTELGLNNAPITVAQGTVLRVELSARVYGVAGRYTQVVLADLLPGGFEIVLSHPDDALPKQENANSYLSLDRREDRIVAHVMADVKPQTFVYHLRAVNKGRYTLPAVYGEGLNDRSLNSHSAAGTIQVQ